MSIAARRLQREMQLMQHVSKEDGVKAQPKDANNLAHWEGAIEGPPGSPYENGVFKIKIIFPSGYPFKPPKVTFMTRIYHMNISASGYVCLDMLDDGWTAGITVQKMLIALRSLLDDPNPESPLVSSIAAEYLSDRARHDAKARRMTAEFAKH